MLTLEEIGGKIKEFGDKAVSGLDAVTKGLDALKADVTSRFEKIEKRVDDVSSASRERPNAGTRVEVVAPNASNTSIAKGMTILQNGGDVWSGKGFENAQTELAMFRQGVVDRLGAKDWGEAEGILRTEIGRKSLSLSSTTSAGGLIPTQLMTEIISYNRSALVLDALGVRRIDGLVGSPVEWNRKTGVSTFRATGENPGSDFTADDLTYTQIQLTPHEFVGVIESSNRLLMLNPALIEGEIRNDLVEGYARKIQAQAITGTGISGNCLGLLNRSTVATTATVQGTVSTASGAGAMGVAYPVMVDAIRAISSVDNPVDNLKWLMHPNDLWDIRKTGQVQTIGTAATQGAGTMFPPIFQSGDPGKPFTDRVAGYPVITTTDMTEGTLALGKWDEMAVGTWSGVELTMSNVAGSYFLRNKTGWRAIFNMDVAIFKPGAFSTVTSFSV